MAVGSTNSDQIKQPRNPVHLAGEIGLWVSILTLITLAALQGFSSIAKIKGDAGSFAAIESWSQASLWVVVPVAVLSALVFLTQPSTRTTDEAPAN